MRIVYQSIIVASMPTMLLGGFITEYNVFVGVTVVITAMMLLLMGAFGIMSEV